MRWRSSGVNLHFHEINFVSNNGLDYQPDRQDLVMQRTACGCFAGAWCRDAMNAILQHFSGRYLGVAVLTKEWQEMESNANTVALHPFSLRWPSVMTPCSFRN